MSDGFTTYLLGSVHIGRVTFLLNGYNAFIWSYSHCIAGNIKGINLDANFLIQCEWTLRGLFTMRICVSNFDIAKHQRKEKIATQSLIVNDP